MSRRTTTTPTGATSTKPTTPTMKTDLDDWETDPDFVSDFGEIEQRWGNKRTVGSINMNELIDDVRREHQKIRDKFNHSSSLASDSMKNYDYHEKLSKHVTQETRKEIFSSKDNVSGGGGDLKDVKRTVFEKNIVRESSSPRTTALKMPPVAPKPDFSKHDFTSRLSTETSKQNTSDRLKDDFPDIDDDDDDDEHIVTSRKWRPSTTSPKFEESSSFKRFEEKKSSSSTSSLRKSGELPPAFKSIQDKIDAFKREFEDIESKVSKKSDLSKVIKKTTNVEKSSTSKSNLEQVSRYGVSNNVSSSSPVGQQQDSSYSGSTQSGTARPASSSPLGRNQNHQHRNDFQPKSTNNIKSLSEKFETLYREDEDDFKRRTEAKRREFFDQIKHQVRETRKGLDGFDPIDDDDDKDQSDRVHDASLSSKLYSPTSARTTTRSPATAPKSPPSSFLSSSSVGKPKVYTRSETTKEEVVSKIVKENDKIVQNETKRNVERKSSCHGSSDEENVDGGEPTSIKYLNEKMRSSPQQRAVSPIDELKRKVPVVEPEVKGGGLMARALFDYNASEEDELTFDVDDLITNIEKVDPGWYKGTMTKGGQKKVGLFPANHVKLLNDDGEY